MGFFLFCPFDACLLRHCINQFRAVLIVTTLMLLINNAVEFLHLFLHQSILFCAWDVLFTLLQRDVLRNDKDSRFRSIVSIEKLLLEILTPGLHILFPLINTAVIVIFPPDLGYHCNHAWPHLFFVIEKLGVGCDHLLKPCIKLAKLKTKYK